MSAPLRSVARPGLAPAVIAVAALGIVLAPALAPRAHGAEPPLSIARAAQEWLSPAPASGDGMMLAPAGILPPPPHGDDWETDDWDWVDRAEPLPDTGRKSPLKAVLASALLPGLGERYVGSTGRANLFHATEAVVWATFAGYRIQGELRRDRYEEFAVTNAGAPGDGDTDYYEHIGLWLSLEEWHDIVRRDARLRFPDDPAAQAAFFETNQRYDEGEAWDWGDDETRVRYRQLRSRSERSFRNGRLAVGAAIVNRLASMMDALALARRANRDAEEARVNFRIAPQPTADGLAFGPVLSARY